MALASLRGAFGLDFRTRRSHEAYDLVVVLVSIASAPVRFADTTVTDLGELVT